MLLKRRTESEEMWVTLALRSIAKKMMDLVPETEHYSQDTTLSVSFQMITMSAGNAHARQGFELYVIYIYVTLPFVNSLTLT